MRLSTTQLGEPQLTPCHSLIDAKNKVPEYQRFYQAAYKAHTRLWKIVRTSSSRSRNSTPLLTQADSTLEAAGTWAPTSSLSGEVSEVS
jgi:hypothetical protein